MNAKQQCPDADTLKSLLEGGLTPESETTLQAHLESCDNCQRRLAALVDGDEAIAQLAEHLRAPLSELSPQIIQAAQRLSPLSEGPQQQSDETLSGGAGDTTVQLEFLAEAEDPACIGRLGPYDIRGVIGRGGMGVVLEGYDRKLNRTVAVKVMAPEVAANPVARRRFLREAQAAAAISHDHVVTIHAIDEEHHPPYLVLEFVHGESLQQKLDREGPLELKEVLRIGMQAARGLEAAHAQGLVHRDVKPSNILLENGVQRARLTDFGLARAVDDLDVTRTGEVAGTPEYMSPEQAENHPLDPRSDLFSLGSVLYAMCAGRSPFRADNMAAVIRRVCEKSPRPLCEMNPDIPPWLAEIIDRLLEKDPPKRYQSAGEVAEVLGSYLAHLQDPQRNPAPAILPRGGIPTAPARRRRWWPFTVASLLLLLAGVLATTEATGVTRLQTTVIRLVYGEGTLVLEVEDPDVSVTIDGPDLVIAGAGPQQLRLTPGSYKVTATKDGRPVKSELVTITRGGREVVSVTMEGKAASPAPSTASRDNPRLFAHGTSVSAVAVSPDGKLVAAAGGVDVAAEEFSPTGDYSISLWDVASGSLVKRLTGHRQMIWPNGLCFSPDGAYLASGSFDKTVRLWDIASGSQTRQYVHEDCVTAVDISPDGGRLLSGSRDGTAVLWDLGEGTELRRFKGHESLVLTVAFSPDGRQVVTAGGSHEEGHDSALRLWNAETGELVRAIPNDFRGINAVRFLDDGERLLMVGLAKTGAHSAQVWDVQVGRKLGDIGDSRSNTYAVVSSDGFYMLAGDYGQTMQLWDLRTNKGVAQYLHEDQIRGVALSPDLRLAFSACNDGNVYAWRLPESVWRKDLDGAQDGDRDYRAVPPGSITRVQRLQVHSGQVTGVTFLPDGRQCLSGSGDGTMRLWDVATGKSLRQFDAHNSISQTALSPSGVIAASAHHDGRIFLWDIETGKKINELKGHTAQVYNVEFSPDGKLLLSRSGDKTIRLWDVNQGTELQRLDCEQAVSTAAIFAGHNDHILVADGTRFAMWSLKPVEEVWSAEIGTHPIWNLAISPDADLAALASGAGKIYVVRKEDGSLVATFQPHTLSRMRFTPDGRHLVSGGQDGSLRIWSLETLSEVARLEAQTHCTDRIDVSPDGRFVISGSGSYLDSTSGQRRVDDTDLHLWQLPESVSTKDLDGAQDYRAVPEGSIARVRRLTGHTGMVRSVAMLPDGRRCLSGSADRHLRQWDTETGEILRDHDTGGYLNKIAVSPDGRMAATGDNSGNIVLWNLDTGERLRQFVGHEAAIHRLEFTTDGRRLLSRSSDKTIRIWNVADGAELKRRECVWDQCGAAAFASDAGDVIFADDDKLCRWNPDKNEDAWSAPISHRVWHLRVSPNGRDVATDGGGGYIDVWAAATGRLRGSLSNATATMSLSFTRDSRHLVCGSTGSEPSIHVWSLDSFSKVCQVETSTHCTAWVAVSPDGRYVVSGGDKYLDHVTGEYLTDDVGLHVWTLPESVWTMDFRIEQASRAIEENPADANTWFARAQLYIQQSQWEQAADDMWQAVQKAPEDPFPRLAYPALLIKAGKQQEYGRFCRLLLEKFRGTEDLSDADKVIKICLMQPGEFEASELPLEVIDRRLAMQDEYGARITNCTTRALACYRSGDMQGAIRWARQGVMKPDGEPPHLHARWLLILAMAHHATGNHTQARRDFEEARRLFEQNTPFATAAHHPNWTTGWLVADVLRSEAVDVLGMKDEQGAFVVLDSEGAEVGKFDVLAAAVERSSAGDTIEIRGDGPFIIDPIEIPHPLTIRAADGFRPTISNLEPPEVGVPLLLHRAPLVLEGLEFDLACQPISTVDGGNLIVGQFSSHAALYCGNCTFRKTTDPARSDVFLHPCIGSAAHDIHLVNCQIATRQGYSIHWNCAPGGRFRLKNCLVDGAMFFNSSRAPVPDVSIRFQCNTFLGEGRLAYLVTDRARSAEDEKELLPRIRFEALQNVFDTKGSILHFGANLRVETHTAADALALLSREVAWNGEQNLLPVSDALLEMRVGEQTVQFDPPINAARWQTIWQMSDSGAVTGTVRYQSGDLRAKRLAQKSLSPEDFRLHSESAGYQAGPEGQDLGADVDLVGPGEAYQRWKQTDEYTEWQSETRDLVSAAIEKDREALVILDADAQVVRKFATLAEAVAGSSDGDTIEIRGKGPFLIEPLVIDHALTIKAADGFQPLVEGIASDDQNQLLTARAPLVMEGLDIHWKQAAQERREATVIRAYAPLGMANCRVRGDGQACLWAGQDSVLRNCQFFSGIGWNPPSGGSYRVENCIAGSLCLFPRDVKDASLHLHGNTFLASAALCMIPTEDPQTALEDPLAKVIRVSSSRNLFSVPTRQLFALQTGHLSESYDAARAGALLRRVVGWSEQQNLYPNNVPLLVLFRDDEEPLSGDYRQDFEGWNRFWELEDTGSSQGAVIYAGGNLEVKLKDDPAHLMPEDFRLRPDSAGYRAGPDGEDLGAEVDLVGPGEAYERWKQTAEYKQWLGDTRKLMALSTTLDDSPAATLSTTPAEFNELSPAEKIEHYSDLIRQRPDIALTYAYRSEVYWRRREYAKAIDDCTSALRIDPQLSVAYLNRGVAYYETQDYDKALADLNEAIRLDGGEVGLGFGHCTSYLRRGLAHFELGHYDDALADIEKSIQCANSRVIDELIRAQVLVLTDQPDEYRRACAEGLKRHGEANDPSSYCHAVRMCLLAPNPSADLPRLIELAERAISQIPTGAYPRQWMLYTLGMAHFRAGQTDKADESFRASLKADPSWEASALDWLGLALVEQARGETANAKRWLDKALQSVEQSSPRTPQDRIEIRILRRELQQLLAEDAATTAPRDSSPQDKPQSP